MPNETLIIQLDHSREIYTQQQKATIALQAALKTITAGVGKTQKAISDYRLQNKGADVRSVQEVFANLQLKEDIVDPLLPDLRRELKALITLTVALKDAAVALRSEPVDVVRLDKAITALQAAPQQDVLDLLPHLSQELELGQRVLGSEFGQKLRDALAALGIAIGGRSPKFEIGRFEMEANFAKRFITLRYGRELVVPRASITIEAAIKAYDGASKAVIGRSQNGQTWIAQFYEAYETALRKRNTDNKRINIVECYIEMVLLRQGRAFSSEPSKRTFIDYSRAQFIYDFYKFVNHQRLVHRGQVVKAHVASKSQTDSPAKSMWIVEGDGPTTDVTSRMWNLRRNSRCYQNRALPAKLSKRLDSLAPPCQKALATIMLATNRC